MMVRVDDRQMGLDDLLTALVEPVRANRRMAAWRDRGLRHLLAPPKLAFAPLTLPCQQGERYGFCRRSGMAAEFSEAVSFHQSRPWPRDPQPALGRRLSSGSKFCILFHLFYQVEIRCPPHSIKTEQFYTSTSQICNAITAIA
jgi:hypothetical protein